MHAHLLCVVCVCVCICTSEDGGNKKILFDFLLGALVLIRFRLHLLHVAFSSSLFGFQREVIQLYVGQAGVQVCKVKMFEHQNERVNDASEQAS
jgi:hypothetical protein